MGVLGGKIREGVVRYWPPTNSFLLFGVLTSVPILVKIDQEMRPWECSQTDRHTHTHTHTDTQTQTDFIICPMLYAIAMGQIMRILYVRQRSLYLISSFVLSQEISEQEWCEKILAFWWQHQQESSVCSGVFFYLRLWQIIVQWVALVKFKINDRTGDGTDSFKVKIRMNTAKFTNMIIARSTESRYLVRESVHEG